MKLIQTRDELVQFARDMRVRPDWHEPDEQGLTADVFGRSFDNAGTWPLDRAAGPAAGRAYSSDPERSTEMYVVLYQSDDSSGTTRTPMAAVNLATLFAWASETSPHDDDAFGPNF